MKRGARVVLAATPSQHPLDGGLSDGVWCSSRDSSGAEDSDAATAAAAAAAGPGAVTGHLHLPCPSSPSSRVRAAEAAACWQQEPGAERLGITYEGLAELVAPGDTIVLVSCMHRLM